MTKPLRGTQLHIYVYNLKRRINSARTLFSVRDRKSRFSIIAGWADSEKENKNKTKTKQRKESRPKLRPDPDSKPAAFQFNRHGTISIALHTR